MKEKLVTRIDRAWAKSRIDPGSIAERALRVWSNIKPRLETMGMMGWALVVPTFFGAAIGLWLDDRYGGGHSWTLSLVLIGLSVGCFNNWNWNADDERLELNQRKLEADPEEIDM